MALSPVYVQESKVILINQSVELIPYMQNNPTPIVFQGITNSMFDYIMMTNFYLWNYYLGLEVVNLETILSYPLPFDITPIQNRINGLNAFLSLINKNWLQILTTMDTNQWYAGKSSFTLMPDMILELVSFDSEILSGATLVDSANAEYTARTNAYDYAITNINVPATTTDACSRMASVSKTYIDILADLDIPSGGQMTQQLIWNQIVAVPGYMQLGDILDADFTQPFIQEIFSLKALSLKILVANSYLYAAGTQQASAPSPRVQLRDSESLMAFAARTTGNYENWLTIAQINNLVPPYVSTIINPVPSTAQPGQYLYLPPGPNLIPTNYVQNILGTDIYLGPFNQNIPSWYGDFNISTGVTNYQIAVNRRVITPVGTYIYDQTYGSRIPIEIGAAVNSDTGRLQAYAKSAILGDPRTKAVASLTVNGNAYLGLYEIFADIAPIGFENATINFSNQ